MKKFYTTVTTQEQEGGYAVLLDGRSIKTPAKQEMLAPTQALANEIMQEWAGQGEQIAPDTMPLTQFLSTKIDRVRPQRAEISEATLKYINTDMICYYADRPEALKMAQEKAWKPIQAYIERKFDCALETTTGLAALSQDQKLHDAMRAYVEALDEDRFTLLQITTSISGSILTALMFIEGALEPEDVLKAARVEEHYKDTLYDAEKYGRDPLFEKKDAEVIRDLSAISIYYKNLM